MAEEKGFEPLRRVNALRDFESRLFDQLEYSSVLTGLLYQQGAKKSSILRPLLLILANFMIQYF